MLYLVDFHIAYPPTMTQAELFGVWSREAEVALGAKQQGVVVDLWKVVGERRVVAVVDADSPDTMDRILFDLPIMKEHGHSMHVEVKALRRYEDFAADVNARL